jgi:hypothetical protein
MWLTISLIVSRLSLHSSDTITIFGEVFRAHSSAKWDDSFPITLMKYQYLTAEALSVSMLPTNCEYTFDAVSKPIDVCMYLW